MKFRRTVAVGLLLLLLLGSVRYQPVAAQTGSQTFPQTGQTVRGRFLQYWQQNGGLAQQGYPISGEFEERSDLDGKTYRVQYFERATFELHPENKAPYDVLLSQLGTFRFREKYGAAGAPGQRANAGNARIFPETGKQIGGRFRTYWERNGGLAQQGFPISNEFEEVSPLDGKVYTVQYFERAVFEVHNENRAPYDVLLSQLGRFRYAAKYKAGTPVVGSPVVGSPTSGSPIPRTPRPATPAAGTPTPGTPAAGTPTPGNSAINPGPPQQLSPGVTGLVIPTDRYVFWQNSELNGPSSEVYGYDIQTRQPFTATTAPGERFLITGSGDQLIWIDVTDVDSRLILYNASTRQITPLATTLPDNFSGTALANGVLYYGVIGEEQGSESGTFAYSLSNSRVQKISDIPAEGLLVSGDALVAATTTSDDEVEVLTTTIRLFNLTGGNERVIGTVRGGFSGFDADANRVVWAGSFDDSGDTGLFIYERSSGRTTRFLNTVAYNPVLKGNLLAWTTYNETTAGPNASLKVVNLSGGPTTTIIGDLAGEIITFGFAGTDTLVYTVLDEASSGEDVPIRLFIVKLGAGSASLPAAGEGARKVASGRVELMTPANGKVFWLTNNQAGELNHIHRYDPINGQTSTITATTNRLYSIVGDQQHTAWLEQTSQLTYRALSYNSVSGQVKEYPHLIDPQLANLQFRNKAFYYSGSVGIISWSPDEQSGKLLNRLQTVHMVVGSDGIIATEQVVRGPSGELTTTVHLMNLDGSSDQVLAQSPGADSLALSKDYAAWAGFPIDGPVNIFLHDRKSGNTKQIGQEVLRNAVFLGSRLVWWSSNSEGSLIRSYDLKLGQTSTLFSTQEQIINLQPLDDQCLAYSTRDSIYLLDLTGK